jgi:hypothetical protein
MVAFARNFTAGPNLELLRAEPLAGLGALAGFWDATHGTCAGTEILLGVGTSVRTGIVLGVGISVKYKRKNYTCIQLLPMQLTRMVHNEMDRIGLGSGGKDASQ